MYNLQITDIIHFVANVTIRMCKMLVITDYNIKSATHRVNTKTTTGLMRFPFRTILFRVLSFNYITGRFAFISCRQNGQCGPSPNPLEPQRRRSDDVKGKKSKKQTKFENLFPLPKHALSGWRRRRQKISDTHCIHTIIISQ